MNVPGPNGGYPIVLSYKSGIGIDQEATWVGLGWRLTAGSINRSIYGVADDAIAETINISAGSGERSWNTFSLGLSYKGISIAAQNSWGDINTFSGSMGMGGVTINSEGSVGVNIGSAISSIAQITASTANPINPSVANLGSAPISLNINSSSGFSMTSNISLNNSLGVSISTSNSGSSAALSVSRGSANLIMSQNNSSSAGFSSNITTKGVTLPLINFGQISFTENKSDWRSLSIRMPKKYGIINTKYSPWLTIENTYSKSYNEFSHLDYSLDVLESDKNKESFYISSKRDQSNQLMIPAFDNYVVSGQGMNFQMQPRVKKNIQLYSFGQNTNTTDFSISSDKKRQLKYTISQDSKHKFNANSIQFMNVNSNSGNWHCTTGNFKNSFSANDFTNFNPVGDMLFNPTSKPNSFYIDNNRDFVSNLQSSEIDDKLGAEFIEYFTNKQIVDDNSSVLSKGFIEASGLSINDRSNETLFPDESIGAFKITNSSGLTYHYSLPIYQRETLASNKFSVNEDDHVSYSMSLKPYALNWLLTAITGPDYIDVNSDNLLNEEDYGYWVEFDYGKFSDGYRWGEIENNKKLWGQISRHDVSHFGLKDIYYLNSIKTASHTAFFTKGIREDGLNDIQSENKIVTDAVQVNNYNSDLKMAYSGALGGINNHKVLRLENIILMKNDDISSYFSFNESNYNIPISNDFESSIQDFDNCMLSTPSNNCLEDISFEAFEKGIPYTSLRTVIKPIEEDNGGGILGNISFESIVNAIFGADLGSDVIEYYNLIDEISVAKRYIQTYNREHKVHLVDNIFDLKEYQLNEEYINSKALKIVEFDYDYSLKKQMTNSGEKKGLLTLNKIYNYGRNKILSQPPYEFEYNNDYDKDHNFISTQSDASLRNSNADEWGYFSLNYSDSEVDNWSLRKIKTPLGSEIFLEHEEDEYSSEYVYSDQSVSYVTDIEYIEPGTGIAGNSYFPIYKLTFPSRYGNKFEYLDDVIIDVNYMLNGSEDINSNIIETDQIEASIAAFTPDRRSIYIKIEDTDDITIFNNLLLHQQNWHNPLNIISYFRNQLSPTYFHFLEVKVHQSSNEVPRIKGGGLRVKSTSLTDFDGSIQKIIYEYDNDEGNSSGVTSYAPKIEYNPIYIPYKEIVPQPSVVYGNVTTTVINVNGECESKTKYVFDVPKSESVVGNDLYEIEGFLKITANTDNVTIYGSTIENSENNNDNYEYVSTPKSSTKGNISRVINFGGATQFSDYPIDGDPSAKSSFVNGKFTIKNQLSNLGRILKIERLNNYGQVLSEKINKYVNAEDLESGISTESFTNKKLISTTFSSDNSWNNYFNVSFWGEIPRL